MREISMGEQSRDVLPTNTFMVYGPTKCISGDAFIGYSVRTPEGECRNSKGGSLARLFHRFHRLSFPGKGAYQRKQTVDSEFWAPSMTEDGRIFQNKIVDVIDSGLRECVRIRTAGGLELICTPDHPVAIEPTPERPQGFQLASELVGASVLVHRNVPWTLDTEAQERIHRPELYVKHHPFAPTKVVRDPVRGYEHVYKRLRRNRAVYEAHMNGLSLDEYTARLNDGRLDGLKFLSRDVDIHHRDENKLNDVPENLVALSRSEHMRHHFLLPNGRPRTGSFVAVEDEVISIESAGKHQTYDIKMAAPYHNFVADGFVVHNSGKTTIAGTYPRPLFFSDISEHGYESLREENWDSAATPLFEEGVRPIVWGFDKESDIDEMVKRARPLVEAGVVYTICVDSITYLSDLIFNSILMGQGKRDSRAAYGELGVRLRNVRIKIASLGASVCWLAHAKTPDDEHPLGGPMIPGAQSEKFAGSVDFLWYTRFEQMQPSKPGTFDIHTRKFGSYPAGTRLGARAAMLPSPMHGTYTDFLTMLGYDVDAIRGSLPPIDKARIRGKELTAKLAATTPTPPVTQAAASTSTPTKGPVFTTPAKNNGKTVAPTAKQ